MLRQVDDKLDTLMERFLEMTSRMGSLEDQIVGMRTDVVRLEHRMDNFDKRLVRIERQLNLIEA
jgi:chromosome segregation ATPase